LLAADAGHSDEEIARTVPVGGSTVYRTKRRFVEGNLERALSEDRVQAQSAAHRQEEALLVATACRQPSRGSRPLDAGAFGRAMVKLTDHESLSRNGCAGGSRKRSQAVAQGYVVAFPGSTASMSPAWKTCSTSMPKRPIPTGGGSASTMSPVQPHRRGPPADSG